MSICMAPMHAALDLSMFPTHLALLQRYYHTMQSDSDPFAAIRKNETKTKQN